ncbi:MAG: ferric reductase-like transmembrane domain-containing protein [Bacteroidetes bacterium]|nr:ferric reductase-like transmembrane domain-containing protein [Bacteroidota bacterium]
MENQWLELSSNFGLIATCVLTFNLFLGMLLSSAYKRSPIWKKLPPLIKRVSLDDLHNWTAYVALGLVLGHMLFLLPDASLKYKPLDLFFPVNAPHQVFWTILGALAFYALLAVIITTQKKVKSRLGFRLWKNIHLVSYGTALLFVVHGVVMDPLLKDRPVDWFDAEKVLSELCGLALIGATIIRYRHFRRRGQGAVA